MNSADHLNGDPPLTEKEILLTQQLPIDELVNLSPVSILIVDQEGIVLYTNEAFCRYTGYIATELLQTSLTTLLVMETEDSGSWQDAGIIPVLLENSELDWIIRAKSGLHLYTKISMQRLLTADDQIRYAAYFQDRSELREEMELRLDLAERLRIVEENDLIGFGVFRNSDILYANSAMLKFFGLRSPLDRNLRNTQLVFNQATQKTKEAILARRKSEEEDPSIIERPFIGEFIGGNGEIKLLEIHPKEIDLNGHPGRLVFVLDITEKKRAEIELTQTNEKLQQSLAELGAMSKVREQFFSTISHEIRTPLNSVIGLSNLLLRRAPREDQLDIIQTLKHSADNLLHLVNDILNYSKIQAGKLELEYTNCNVAECMNHLHLSFAETARQQGLEYYVITDPQIPANILADITRLNQIFNNLVANAIKFTAHGYVKFRATLESQQRETCTIVFKVIDTGIGIHPDKLEHVFEPFQQSDADISRKYGGTGLGLSIVKALVDLLGGEIWVESSPGQGTSFFVRLKFVIPASPAGIASVVPNRMPADKLSILYVEDVDSNRFLVEQLLADHGIACTLAVSGQEALELTASQHFDLILMDIQMPNMDGYEATDRIRAQENGKNKQTPIVAFTAEPFSDKIKSRLVNQQLTDVVTKPFDIDEFIDKITRISTHQGANTPSRSYSFEFYERAFHSNAKKLKELRELISNDLSLFKVNLQLALGARNRNNAAEEIHRIRPILKNLKADSIIELLDEFNNLTMYERGMEDLVDKISQAIDDLVEMMSQTSFD